MNELSICFLSLEKVSSLPLSPWLRWFHACIEMKLLLHFNKLTAWTCWGLNICRFWIAEQGMKLKLLPGYVLQCRYIFPSIWTEYLQILDDTLVWCKNIVAGVCSMMHIQISAFIHVLKQGCFIIQVQSIWIEKIFTHGNMNKKKKKSMSGSSYLRSIHSFGLWIALIYTTSGQGGKRWMDSSTMQICFGFCSFVSLHKWD